MKAEDITNLIVAELEKGSVPWRKPWTVAGMVPTSLQTGKPYRGINSLLLALYADLGGYGSNLWVTFKQAQALGGTVRKGEKGSAVVFWKKWAVEDDDATDGQKTVMMMRQFTVFNVEQCDGLTIPDKYAPKPRTWTDSEALQAVVDGYQNAPEIRFSAQDKAYYSPTDDKITLPPVEAFPTLNGYAETLLHELTHSTGHKSRLNRFTDEEKPVRFGDANYAREELVAELGAMMLMAHAGIAPDMKQGAAYVGGWLKALENDKRLIIGAAQRAAKAVECITGAMTVEEEAQEAA